MFLIFWKSEPQRSYKHGSYKKKMRDGRTVSYTRNLFYKNHVYKNVEAQKCPFFKNIVVILLVAISISFEPQDKI